MANRKLNEPVQVIHGKTEYLAWIKEIIAPGVYKAQWDSLTGEKGQFTLYENQIVVIPPGGRRGSKRTMPHAAAPSPRPKKRARKSSTTAAGSLEAAAATCSWWRSDSNPKDQRPEMPERQLRSEGLQQVEDE